MYLFTIGTSIGAVLLDRQDGRRPFLDTCFPWSGLFAEVSRELASAVRNGHIKRITDPDIASSVLEIASANVSTTYISCPADQAKTLGIKLPFLILIVKNMKKYFTFEVQVLDDKNVRRRFRASNYQARPLHWALQMSKPC